MDIGELYPEELQNKNMDHLDDAERIGKKLQIRHLLDFKEEEEHLMSLKRQNIERKKREDQDKFVDEDFEIDKDDNQIILHAYRLAKRKEEAMKKLNDDNIKIFCGEDNLEELSIDQLNQRIKIADMSGSNDLRESFNY